MFQTDKLSLRAVLEWISSWIYTPRPIVPLEKEWYCIPSYNQTVAAANYRVEIAARPRLSSLSQILQDDAASQQPSS
jgi:hypothetical protein